MPFIKNYNTAHILYTQHNVAVMVNGLRVNIHEDNIDEVNHNLTCVGAYHINYKSVVLTKPITETNRFDEVTQSIKFMFINGTDLQVELLDAKTVRKHIDESSYPNEDSVRHSKREGARDE